MLRTTGNIGSCHRDRPREAGTAQPRRLHTPSCKTSADGYQRLPLSLSLTRCNSQGILGWPPSKEKVSPPPQGTEPTGRSWFLRGTPSHHPWPCQHHPSLGSSSRPCGACVVCYTIVFICSCERTCVSVHMLGHDHGQNGKGKEVRLQGRTHHRLSVSPHPFSPALR